MQPIDKTLPKSGRLRQFWRDQRGTISIFSMSLMVVMVGVGGLAVDSMRLEQQRVHMQNSLDRCTLMAASLKQAMDAESVVKDCMDREGLKARVTKVTEVKKINVREVTSEATTTLNTLFPNAIGITNFNFASTSKAVHRVSKIEISLALDVSGSMVGTRLTDLKKAARDFVTNVLKGDTEKKVSISIVPYSGQVNLGSTLRPYYAPTYTPAAANMNCVDIPDTTYNALSLSTGPYPMTGKADTWTVNGSNVAMAPSIANGVWCKPSTANIVTVANQDESQLHNAINALVAEGATSINLGMRWGLALLDPGTRPVFNSMFPATTSTSGGVTTTTPSSQSGRPFDYTEPEMMKIMVLMTDGDHWPMEKLNDGYQSGLSPIYLDARGNYSIYHADKSGTTKYYRPSNGAWSAAPYKQYTTDAAPVQQTWQQVWDKMRVQYVAQNFYANALGSSNSNYSFTNTLNRMRTLTPASTMDSQLQSVCTLAKNQGVIVYGIAFQASTAGQTQIKNCASSDAHYFKASGTTTAGAQLNQAFNMIATNITQLKLTL